MLFLLRDVEEVDVATLAPPKPPSAVKVALIEARQKIANGWVQGTLHKRTLAYNLATYHFRPTDSYCAVGAVQHKRTLAYNFATYHFRPTDSYCAVGAVQHSTGNWLVRHKAYRQLRKAIGRSWFPFSVPIIEGWNDSGFRSQREVLLAFDKAIENTK